MAGAGLLGESLVVVAQVEGDDHGSGQRPQ
jgi:hypothetical protein